MLVAGCLRQRKSTIVFAVHRVESFTEVDHILQFFRILSSAVPDSEVVEASSEQEDQGQVGVSLTALVSLNKR